VIGEPIESILYKERNKQMTRGMAELNLHVGELMDTVSTDDCLGNLTIGYLLIWIHTIESNNNMAKVMKLSKFQESLIDRYQATSAQVADSFNRATSIFQQYTGITIPREDNPRVKFSRSVDTDSMPSEVYPITSKLYLN
jgi:hypothetical protein